MKLLIAVLGCILTISNGYSQTSLTPADWQADLQFLQETVHKDYSFLFKKVTQEKFDAEVDKLDKAIPTLQEHEIVAGLTRIVALFQYGHTGLGHGMGAAQFHSIPINLYQFSDGIFIQAAHKDYADAVGAKVLKIEGMPVDEALQTIRPLVPVENEQYLKAHGLSYLCIPEALHAQRVTSELKNSVTLTLERDGKHFDKTFTAIPSHRSRHQYGFIPQGEDWLDARDSSQTPFYLKDLDKTYYFEYLPEQKTVYVRHSQILDIPNEPIPAFYERLFDFIDKNEVDRLVLDVRLNGGGNNYKNKPIVTGIVRCEKINQPGKLFVIIGRRTFSACQNLVNELDNYTNAIFVGEPTSENINFYGDNRRVDLPHSKIPVFLSFAWWQDKPQWENGPWLAPDIAVDMSFDDFRNNRDPVLDAALSVSSEGALADPMGHLRELFEAQKLELVRSEAAAMVKDARYKFVDFERQLNDAGYNLVRDQKAKEALYVFQLNTELFPNSANVWDSLAEWHWKSNDKEKAIQYYQKALELDPDGVTGFNAKNMLRQINEAK